MAAATDQALRERQGESANGGKKVSKNMRAGRSWERGMRIRKVKRGGAKPRGSERMGGGGGGGEEDGTQQVTCMQ